MPTVSRYEIDDLALSSTPGDILFVVRYLSTRMVPKTEASACRSFPMSRLHPLFFISIRRISDSTTLEAISFVIACKKADENVVFQRCAVESVIESA